MDLMPAVVKIEPESQRELFDYSNRSEKVSIDESGIGRILTIGKGRISLANQ